ncbi:MAG TPA: hypothetical protein VFQ75_03215 [Candidatus Limnocylindrales bacterium]|nr:hypothetical protein [Candidatus Limnocylindrales bacterium]
MDQPPDRIAALVARGTLDAELAALLSLLLEARVPAIVAGTSDGARDALLDALPVLLPTGARVIGLAGDAEEFEWMPEATELGWRREHNVAPAARRDATPRASSSTAVLLARDLAGTGPAATGGPRARLAVRALSLGYGMLAGMAVPDLEGVLATLASPAVGADDDELSRLGVVLAVADVARGQRILAAHYVRPVSRDTHGHVQRLPPAVLATWNMVSDTFDHFAWGVLPELAIRLGVRPIDLEREQARRAGTLRGSGV